MTQYDLSVSLDQMGIECGTDKASTGHNYLNYYEKEFNYLHFSPIKLLEIGIYHGDSLRLWKRFFPNAQIFGIDIDDCSQHDEERIKTIRCSQDDQAALRAVCVEHGPFDIVIIDGSHQSEHDIITFNTLFPLLKAGGIYVNEDTLCSYVDRFTDYRAVSIIEELKCVVDDINMGGKQDPNLLCANKIKERDKWGLNELEYSVEYITFYCGAVVIKKL